MATLSVLMPVYNAGRFLRAAIDSILQQSFTDFEFLIIDDCSTDDSAAIIQSYTDPRIRYVRNAVNKGITPTLNRGIELATTEWIVRMDSDDISYPNRLQQQYDFVAAHPDGVLYSCDVRVITEDGKLIRIDDFAPEFYYYNLAFICWIYHPSVVMRKTAVQQVGMYTVPFSEDFEIFWQLTRHHKHYHQKEVLLDYRSTAQSLHMVTKRTEYEEAQQQQVLRNLQYYKGKHFMLPASHIECLRHRFEPLLAEQSARSVASCLRSLEAVSAAILQRENINRNAEAIQRAAAFKRNFILRYFVQQLPKPKATLLLLLLSEYRLLKNIVQSQLQQRLRKSRHRHASN